MRASTPILHTQSELHVRRPSGTEPVPRALRHFGLRAKSDDFSGSLKRAGYDDSVPVLEVTYGGIACGPVWCTDTYGFGFTIVEPEGIAGGE